MLPFGIQPIHLIIVVIVALLIFGPSRLPEIGRGLGKTINEFRKGAKEMTEGFRDEVVNPEAASEQAASQSSVPIMASATVACPQCGATNPANAAFCNKCGTRLSNANSTQQSLA